jgi:hypothetical protein
MFKTSTLQSLQNQSNKALNLFQATIDSLTKTNEQIIAERDKKLEELRTINNETRALNELEAANKKIVDKIQSFLVE